MLFDILGYNATAGQIIQGILIDASRVIDYSCLYGDFLSLVACATLYGFVIQVNCTTRSRSNFNTILTLQQNYLYSALCHHTVKFSS